MASILIIDDEKAIRKTLSEILSFEGYKIEEAADGEEGLKKFKEKTFDVVLCDIKMPKIDGLEFLQKAVEVKSRCSYHYDFRSWKYRNRSRSCKKRRL